MHRYQHHQHDTFFFEITSAIVIGLAITFITALLIRKEERRKKDLNKQSVIAISGACNGIGKELALVMARFHKCNIVIYDTKAEGESNVLSLVQGIEALGGRGVFYECDFKDKNAIMVTLAETLAKFGKIDIFIHTGGATFEKGFEDYCYEEMALMTETHFLGPAFMMKELVTIMKKQSKGHIVHIPTMLPMFESSDIFTYCASKGALSKLLQGIRAGLKMTNSQVKITVARPYFTIGKVKEEVDQFKVRNYARKIFEGIMNEVEEIN